ncbi:MAG: adenylate/guanylate cyclase domain-containing protein [Rhodospirillaceae bacterium]|nr:adenylate/guanylate cyclase domain-containing protein [Rhodospirillaceae bacterium]
MPSETLLLEDAAPPGAPAPVLPQPAKAAVRWLLTEGRQIASLEDLLAGLCQCLLSAGVPIDRVGMHIRTLHPQVAAVRVLWRADGTAPTKTAYGHDVPIGDLFLKSPFFVVYGTGRSVRRRIEDPDCPRDFTILDDLRAEGMTDYYVTPLTFSQGRTHAMTWASRQPGGFSNADIAAIDSLLPAISMIAEARESRRISKTLLDTYLGPQAGARVLNGSIRRGDAETIAAALWFCDMRGFTELSERLPRDVVIGTLNDYFECMAGPIHANGGEILKFIGDALLAIFPIKDDLDRDRVCFSALDAAQEALRDLETLNERRARTGEDPIRVGVALHTGAVMYGNIGAPERLDFTVIGPAVNLVTRIEGLCPVLGRPLLTSARFASPCGSKLVSLGRYPLRGISEEQEVFGLPQ